MNDFKPTLKDLGYRLNYKNELWEEWLKEDGLQSYKYVKFSSKGDVYLGYKLRQQRLKLNQDELEAIYWKVKEDIK